MKKYLFAAWGLSLPFFSAVLPPVPVRPGIAGLGVSIFPALPTTEGGLRPHTRHSRASLGEADFNSLSAPPEHPRRVARVARAVLLRHLGLKGAPRSAGHLRGGQAQISNLLLTDLLRKSPG